MPRKSAFRHFLNSVRLMLLAALLVVVAGLITLGMQYRDFLRTPVAMPADGVVVTIPSGMPAQRVARELARAGVIKDWRLFYLHLRLSGKTRQIKTGDYLFVRQLTPAEVLQKLVRGEVLPRQFTILPGWRVRDVIQALQGYGHMLDLSGLPPPNQAQDLLARMQASNEFAEGWLYPDTYRFERGTNALALLGRAYAKMRQVLDEEWSGRAPDLPLASPYEALILASIIEKETGRADERPLVAAVFINRLRLGMRLQTDPTVIYGMGEAYKGNIRTQDLRQPTPYNTYTITGLPPTPIALPSRASIHAALHPADSDALFFVANGQGGHVFTSTYAEHEAAVQRYLLGRKP
ncbi:MAG: endolytic transglycosylase MltG [Pseudomonadota bacterium]|uniref:endolytic transglycosylase MltG n=1 Tax=Thermithiobacillus tepidarius TaxID=929 RepID=UPI000423483C|nr:endolytic transglycosylase MltG [Thermithiobacillus tepidarius]